MSVLRLRFVIPYICGLMILVVLLFSLNSTVQMEDNLSILYYLPSGVSRQRDVNGVLKEEALYALSRREISRIYHEYVNTPQVICNNIVRAGNLYDGGWDVCMDPGYKPSTPCLVYSFGINNDFSFDDYMADNYGCEVHSYDPSMINVKDHLRGQRVHFHRVGLSSANNANRAWPMKTFSNILKENNHSSNTVDILKFDIEKSEYWVIPDLIKSGSLRNVKQLCFEMHIRWLNDEPDKDKYMFGLSLFLDLYKEGFRIFRSHGNPYTKFTSMFGMKRFGCHELYMTRQT